MPRAVLFDFDGVLIESYEVWFQLMNAAARDFGYPAIEREVFDPTFGQGVEADVEQFYPRHSIPEVEAYFADHFMDHDQHLELNSEAKPVLAALRERGVASAIVTNSQTPLARALVAHLELKPDVVVAGNDVPRTKPAPDMVLRACELLDVTTDAALMVGDSRFDREAAQAAGVRFVGYRMDGDERIEQLSQVLELL